MVSYRFGTWANLSERWWAPMGGRWRSPCGVSRTDFPCLRCTAHRGAGWNGGRTRSSTDGSVCAWSRTTEPGTRDPIVDADAGSPVETDRSGHVRVRAALATLHRDKWLTVEQTVAELRIRLGERARKLNGPTGT